MSPTAPLLSPTRELSATRMLLAPTRVLLSPTRMLSSPTRMLLSPTRMLLSPARVLLSPTRMLLSPARMLLSPARMLLSPTRMLLSPTMMLLSPIRMLLSPTRMLLSPTRMLLSPTMMLLSPIRMLLSPTRMLLSPTRMLLSPTKVLLSPARVLLLQAEMKDVTVYVCTVAEFFHALHHGRTNEEFLCVLDALHTVCVDHGLERAQAAVQHCIDSINSTQGTVTGSSTAGSSAGGIITGRSSHLSPKEIDCCITTSEPVSSTAEHHCGGTGDTDHCCKEVRIKTDHCSNDVTDNDHCCSVVRETDRCCNEVTSSPVRGSIHLLHDNTSYAGSSHCHTPTGTVSVGHCDSSLTDPPTYAPVTERTLVIDTNRTVNSSECGSEYISRLRIHDQNDTADHKNIHLPGDPGLSPHTEASGEGTTALLDGNDTSRIRSALVEDSVCSDACDTSTVCSQLELEAVVHPVCT